MTYFSQASKLAPHGHNRPTATNEQLLRMLVTTCDKEKKKTKSDVCLHSSPHCGQPNHTACSSTLVQPTVY